MARKRSLKPFKYLILGLCIALVTILSPGAVELARSQTPQQQAQFLTEKGQAHLDRGNLEAALESWQQAAMLYRQIQDQQGLARSLINQGIALETLGQFPLACTTLLESLSLEQEGWLCNAFLNAPPLSPMQALERSLEQLPTTPTTVAGMQVLGTVLLRLGALPESKLVLQAALERSERLAKSELKSDLLVSLGNTEQAFYAQARERYSITGDPVLQEDLLATAQAQARSALQRYAESISAAPQTQRLQAQLNALTLLTDAKQWANANAEREPRLRPFQAELAAQIQPLIAQLQQPAAFSQLPPSDAGYARLKFARQLHRLNQDSAALTQAQQALKVAQALGNPRLLSSSFGNLAQLSGQTTQAQAYLEQALKWASQAKDPDLAYQWHHQLGRLYQQQGNVQAAIAAYQAATDSLDQVRGNLAVIDPDFQLSFREEVEPVYRGYMQLLLASSNPDLERVIQTNERLQLAELETFLRCGRLPVLSLDQIQANLDAPPAVVHVLAVGDRYEVIVRSPNRSLHRYSPGPDELKTSATNLLQLVQDPGYQFSEPKDTQIQGQRLYQLLLADARQEGAIPDTGTLVFVLDGDLQNLPMALLHDGEDYLIRHYNLAVALGAQLQPPRRLASQDLRALVGGLSQRSPSFDAPRAPRGLEPLPQTREEVASVREAVDVVETLLDEAFTTGRLQAALSQVRYSILHLSTHGQFSSDPKRTILLDWNQAIDVQQLNQLVEGATARSPLDLLVLSACETAQGDQRSALGLAGVAVQAGASSTLASLWQINAQSTAKLIGEFYHHLKTDTKAEAVRQAQLALLDDPVHPEWHHPYYWSSFILVGGWL